MSLIYEKHEPASIKRNLIGWIKVDKSKKYSFLEEAPNDIKLLNRYLVKKDNATRFINILAKSYDVFSCVYLPNKISYLTNIKKLIKEKNIKKKGLNESIYKKGLFLKQVNHISNEELELTIDYYFDSIYIVSKKHLHNLIQLLDKIDFFNQPKTLGSFYPTEQFIKVLVEYNAAVIYLKRDFCENNSSQERDIFVCYSPWKI